MKHVSDIIVWALLIFWGGGLIGIISQMVASATNKNLGIIVLIVFLAIFAYFKRGTNERRGINPRF